MRIPRLRNVALAALTTALLMACVARAATVAEKPPHIQSFSKPLAGEMQIIFHGGKGPFRIEQRPSIDPSAKWVDVPGASVTELQPGVFMGFIPGGIADLGFYRVCSETDPSGELRAWALLVNVSTPANGTHFVAGETPVVTVSILDTKANGLNRDSMSTLSLYVYGPEDPKKTVSALKLMNATGDRSQNPHHYINLKNNPDVKISHNVLTYPLRPVTDEAPGTYSVAVRAVLAEDEVQQIMKITSIQIGTAEVEKQVVSKESCAQCHEGTMNGKMYLHHIDPGRSPVGSWSLDYVPVTSCKACHNNDGYAAFRDEAGTRIPDQIILRVHGVHNGNNLKLPFNKDENFHMYSHVIFPADIRNCTTCHQDDRWKTQPTRTACGSCHDNVHFGLANQTPAGMEPHSGGAQTNDSKCSVCHAPDPDPGAIIPSIAEFHTAPPPSFQYKAELALSPPANGKFYVGGEAPTLTIKVKNAATGAVIDPRTMVEPVISTNVAPNEWGRARLYVSGPRANTVPVLTSAAGTTTTSSYRYTDVRVRLDASNEDPRVSRTADSIVYQLSDVAGLPAGTYTAFINIQGQTGLGASEGINFQIGTETPEKMVAANCTDCHKETVMHATSTAIKFEPDLCKSCHDNERQIAGRTAWTTSNNGFGAAPLSRRVHGVHYGKYLDKPQEVHRTYDFSEVIFPQDVRNCTKCHSETDTWISKPTRVACNACHDGDLSIVHASLMTFDPTPQEAFSGDEVETCAVCHGKGSAFAPDTVHRIANPFVPIYPREGSE